MGENNISEHIRGHKKWNMENNKSGTIRTTEKIRARKKCRGIVTTREALSLTTNLFGNSETPYVLEEIQ